MFFRAPPHHQRHIHPVHGPHFAVSSSILVFISYGLQLTSVSAFMFHTGGVHPAPAHRRDIFTLSPTRSRTLAFPIQYSRTCLLFQYLLNCGSLPFTLPFSMFNHANLVTTSSCSWSVCFAIAILLAAFFPSNISQNIQKHTFPPLP